MFGPALSLTLRRFETMAKIIGITYMFGVHKELPPIVNAPKGKMRVRMRNDDFVKVFIKNENSIREFRIRCVDGEFCYLCFEQGANLS